MASMTPPHKLFHALLRPAILQILRAAGYHAAKPSVVDSVTDLAARYLDHLCHMTALYAESNSSSSPTGGVAPTIVDVRMALQRAGALLPERVDGEQAFLGAEDMRGVEDFLAWATGPVNRDIKRVALGGEDEVTDYLDALKKKHSKNEDDSKFTGTLLGKPNEHGEVQVEGGEVPSILNWEERLQALAEKQPEVEEEEDSRPPSSGLSSLSERSLADEMEF